MSSAATSRRLHAQSVTRLHVARQHDASRATHHTIDAHKALTLAPKPLQNQLCDARGQRSLRLHQLHLEQQMLERAAFKRHPNVAAHASHTLHHTPALASIMPPDSAHCLAQLTARHHGQAMPYIVKRG
jgi:hypothetical protein